MVTPISSLEKGRGLDYIRDMGITDHMQMSPFLTDWFLLKLSESQILPSVEHGYFFNHKVAIFLLPLQLFAVLLKQRLFSQLPNIQLTLKT